MKNPLNFFKKANKSINIYLKNYTKINEFVSTYDKNQEKIEQFIEGYNENQKHTATFLDAFLHVLEENQQKSEDINKKCDKNQEKIEQFIEGYNENQKHTATFLDAFLHVLEENQQKSEDINKKCDKNQIEIEKILDKTEHYIGAHEKGQVKTEQFMKIYVQDQEKIERFMERFSEDQLAIRELLGIYGEDLGKIEQFMDVYGKDSSKTEEFRETYLKNQTKTDEFIEAYISIKNGLKNTINTFNSYYYSCKDYFFNGEEKQFKFVDSDQFFRMCFFNDIKLLSFSPSENRIYLKTEDNIILSTNNRYYTILEIFGKNGYSIPQLYQFKEFVVFDIGMNRGYASLKFANFDSCKAVYGFEINKETYNFALENFNLNPKLSLKIKPYNFGLYNKNAEVDIYCLHGSDGVTTTELEFTNVQYEWLRKREQMEIKKAKVKEAGPVILDIIEQDEIDCHIVLKIDTEGSESKIIDSLISRGILDKVDLIIGESHLKSENLEDKFDGFTNISKVYHNDIVYGFVYVRDKFYNPLPLDTEF